MKKNLIHLHVHSEYSLLDGLLKISDLVKRAADFEMPAVALTDHGNMYGAIDFYKAAKKAGIKPIIGCEVYQAPVSRFEKKINKDSKQDLYNHLTLLVKNKHGYQNLMKLVSLGFLEGFYYKPRIDAEILARHSEGLIALSGCMSGRVSRAVETKNMDAANKIIEEYIDIFGRDNFYLELTDFNIKKQKEINAILAELAGRHGLKTVATNDVHYLNKEDFKYHFLLLCVQSGMTIGDFRKYLDGINADSNLNSIIETIIQKLAEQEYERKEINQEQSEKTGFFPRTMEYYFKDFKEMSKCFKDFPEALENTFEIASKCSLELDFNLGLIPPFKVPENYSPDDYLKELCIKNLNKKYTQLNPEIEKRLKRELDVIKKMGFAEYFLIVWDFVSFAKNNQIRVGPGRGSAAGSIVSYLLGITDVEPLRYNLLFERFLNEERRKMPDIDIDFCDEKRDEVIKYVTEKYGENRVAQLITFGTMAARQAIRDAGRVLEVPYAEVDRIAKLIPMELNMTIDNAISIVVELRGLYDADKRVRDIIDTAKSLEGKARQHSIHAAGVVISSDDLYNYTPLQRDEKSGDIKTQYKMEDIQEIGLLKMDFLGLKTLSLIDKTLFLIKKTKNIDIYINDISLEDKKTFDMLSSGDSLGVFQLESTGMRDLILNLKPERFEDIIATLALFRPGPLQSGMVSDFVEAKNKNKKIKYLHASLEPILKETYGIILYQEQIMLIASSLAGFSMSEADILRDAISKKKREIITRQKNKFINGTKKTGIIDENTAEKLFELITHFAEYGFNKSHSTAYAMISYQTAYLKANFPMEFMAALLSIRMGSQEKVAQYIAESRKMGIDVLPPDINESYADFTVVKNSIRFGLSAIKNVGINVIESIVNERKKNGRFINFNDFCHRVSSNVLNKKTIESLIKSGVFDSLGHRRKYLIDNFERMADEAVKVKKNKESGQFSLFDDISSNGSGNNDSFAAFSIETEKNNEESSEEYSSKEMLNFEKEMLGLYISGHPLAEYQAVLNGSKTIESLSQERDKSTQRLMGVISSIKQILTRSNQPMFFLTLEDLTDSIEVIVFPTVLERFKELLIEDKVVEITGKIDKKEDQVKLIATEICRASKMAAEHSKGTFGGGIKLSNVLDKTGANHNGGNNYVEDFPDNEDSYAVSDIDHIEGDEYGIKEDFKVSIDKSPEYINSEKSGRLVLSIESSDLDIKTVNTLYSFLTNHPGDTKVELVINNSSFSETGKNYTLPPKFHVLIDDLFLEDLKTNFAGKIIVLDK